MVKRKKAEKTWKQARKKGKKDVIKKNEKIDEQ